MCSRFIWYRLLGDREKAARAKCVGMKLKMELVYLFTYLFLASKKILLTLFYFIAKPLGRQASMTGNPV